MDQQPTDLLVQLFEIQKDFRIKTGMPEHYLLHTDKYRDLISYLHLAEDELNEARELIPMRLGHIMKNNLTGEVDKIEYTREMADVFIFMINTMLMLNISPLDFLNSALRKQQRNFDKIKLKERFVQTGKAPIILIDGPDGVGKSEICKILSQKYQLPIARMVDADRDLIESNSFIYNTTLEQFPGPFIMDRGYPTSIVYSILRMRENDLNYIDNLFSDRIVCVFIIDADEPFRTDEITTPEEWHILRRLYREAASVHQWQVIKNNTTIDNCVAQIINELQF
jgi:hypothetical protein